MSSRTRLFKLLNLFVLFGCLSACSTELKADRFIIASANLDGSDYKIIQQDAIHNMTHPRVSPDAKRIAFTKYFHKNIQGLCLEDDGYFDTAIVVSDIEGKNQEVLVEHQPGVMNANCSWIDNNHIIFIHYKPPESPQIVCLNLDTKEQKVLPTKKNVTPSDPHIVGNTFVYGTIASKDQLANNIWISKIDGTEARQLTHPDFDQKSDDKFNLGDYDPRVSPNGNTLAFMRYFGKDDWRLFTIDLSQPNSKEKELETNLAGAWAMPDWSPDSKKLVAFRINKSDLKTSGIWLLEPNGSTSSKIDLPTRYFIHHPNTYFDPVKKQARIIYGGKYNPGL